MINNKKGVTLMELIAYIAIVGIVVSLLSGTLIYAIRSHDRVNGQGALDTEASQIMSIFLSKAHAINPEYVRQCGTNCVELVRDKQWQINPQTGILEQVPVDDIEANTVKFRIDEGTNSIYLNNMKLNRDGYAVELYQTNANGEEILNSQGEKIPNISYTCNVEDLGTCQSFVLVIRLALYKINDDGESISKTTVYENRFAF